MSFIPIQEKDYSDGRTSQAFKDDTDINKLLVRPTREGTLSHIEAHGGHYGDFTDYPDLMEAHDRLQRGQAIFDQLPAETKREFQNSPQRFFAFVNDPQNADRLHKVLPALAERGNQLPNTRPTGEPRNPVANPAPEANAPPVASEEG
jgi:hypothetical protein